MRSHTFLEVRLDLLKQNFEKLSKAHPKKNVLFMVKSDAYGHGANKLVSYCLKQNLTNVFGVATSGEAHAILESMPHFDGNIYVFSDYFIEGDCYFDELKSDPRVLWVIHHPCLLKIIEQTEKVVVHFDSGMNRLGLKFSDIAELTKTLKNKGIKRIHHLMSHFANSYLSPKNKRTAAQLAEFTRIKNELEKQGVEIDYFSFSNSGAIEQSLVPEENFLRPGLMLYGPQSAFENNQLPMNCISSLQVRPLKVELIKKGTPIGYGSIPLPEDGALCVLPIGYGDGFLTYYSGAKISVSHMPARVVGRVNMDLTYLLFPQSCYQQVLELPYLEFWSHDAQSIIDFAQSNKTIPYQVLCALNSRVVRRYIE